MIPAAILSLLLAAPAQTGAAEVRFRDLDGRTVVEVVGLDREVLRALVDQPPDRASWASLLRVALAPDGRERPPILGAHAVEGETLRFRPRFPFEPGLEYVARFDPSRLPGHRGGEAVLARFVAPGAAEAPATTVNRIDPTPDVLPENILRFYLHFSAPMRRGEVYRRVQILDEQGEAIDLPFLELGEELWNPTDTRLTLLIDPGRIKSGLLPREEAGPVFEEGRSYTLTVDGGWPDARGRPLGREVRKSFRIGPPDDHSPDPAAWRIKAPGAGTSETLDVDLIEPIDRGMVGRLIAVAGPDGRPLAGQARLVEGDRVYRFEPAEPWAAGRYELRVGTALEDPSGNRVDGPFEVDRFRVDRPGEVGRTIEIPFEVAS